MKFDSLVVVAVESRVEDDDEEEGWNADLDSTTSFRISSQALYFLRIFATNKTTI